jgi:hypothetical protein
VLLTPVYDARCARFAAERDRYTADWNRVANIRLVVFIGVALALAGAIWRGWTVLYPVAAVLFIAFVVLVVRHRALGRQRDRYAGLWHINDEARKRVARDWAHLPPRHTAAAPPGHPYAADLDLFGPASPFQLLDSMGTHMGETTLRDWLLAPAPPDVVRLRQAAVAELAPQIDLRDDLALQGRLLGEPKPDPATFLAWAESDPWLLDHMPLLWAGRLSAALLCITLFSQLSGLLADPYWLIPFVFNFLLRSYFGHRVRETLDAAVAGEGTFGAYAAAFDVLTAAQFESPLLRDIRATLHTTDGEPAAHSLRRLHRRAELVMDEGYMLNLPFQLLFLWDLQVLTALEHWQRVAGQRARAWLVGLGQAEALASLAVLAHDNPDWVFPDLEPAAPALTAQGLAHPVLPPSRVPNDVTVGPRGTFLLVTGSNMSGKSTLLRAIGVNLALAGAGGPVCAAAFQTPPVRLWTSMRIQDSLAQGVSYFMAELQRLKAVVDAADSPEPPLFYLLDEILQGTNTAERQIAARRIILHLVHAGALGAVSTHDLNLADAPEVAAVAQPVHLRETFSDGPTGPSMHFDYILRPGIATSTNALRLMQLVGLDVD